VRLLNPKLRPPILAIDTVGFIDRLPHGLVASFRSTLASVLEARLLVHVLDSSHAEVKRHFDVTMSVLEELGASGIPMLLVFNKTDLIKDLSMVKVWAASLIRQGKLPPPIFISALDDKDIGVLRERIFAFFENSMTSYDLLVPFEDGKTSAKIFEIGRVTAQKTTDKGTFYRLLTMPEFLSREDLERFKV